MQSGSRQRILVVGSACVRQARGLEAERNHPSMCTDSPSFPLLIATQEFYARCRASQELIAAQIPWAFAQAEKSRQAAGRRGQPNGAPRPSLDSRGRRRTDSQVSLSTISSSGELTQEEQLLAALLAANEDLMEALRLYDDLERVGIEREAEERSRKETRMDRNVSTGFLHLTPGLTGTCSSFATKISTILIWNQAKHNTPVPHLAARHPPPLLCHPRLPLSSLRPLLQHSRRIHIRTPCRPFLHPPRRPQRNNTKHRPSLRKGRFSLSLPRRMLRLDLAPPRTAMPPHQEPRRLSAHHYDTLRQGHPWTQCQVPLPET